MFSVENFSISDLNSSLFRSGLFIVIWFCTTFDGCAIAWFNVKDGFTLKVEGFFLLEWSKKKALWFLEVSFSFSSSIIFSNFFSMWNGYFIFENYICWVFVWTGLKLRVGKFYKWIIFLGEELYYFIKFSCEKSLNCLRGSIDLSILC